MDDPLLVIFTILIGIMVVAFLVVMIRARKTPQVNQRIAEQQAKSIAAQEDSLATQRAQLAATERQVAVLERIAKALEARAGK
ncbi:MAG: hypothetical protein AAF218_05475 [Pseudomonadota bacterium]